MNADAPSPAPAPDDAPPAARRERRPAPQSDRSLLARIWYRSVKVVAVAWFKLYGGLRTTGVPNMPTRGGALLVSNHLSYLDVFVLGIGSPRPLNYVARSTLFVPILGAFIRSVGGFPIQREGMGASGMKETLKRLRAGGVVTLFPEGTRSLDGELGELKPGIALLVSRAGVPVVPAGLEGTFQALPRGALFPRPRPIRVHFGTPILPSDLEGLDARAVTALIRERIEAAIAAARQGPGDVSGS